MKILLVDDHPAIRRALKTVLEVEEEMEVVGETDNAEEALGLTQYLKPELVILDLRLRGEKSGTELCQQIKALPKAPYVLLYTAHNSPEELISCRLCGADSYVHKSEDVTVLLEVIESTSSGHGKWLVGTEIEGTQPLPQTTQYPANLTTRERQTFALLLKRRTNAEIAKELSISPQTVKTHVANIRRKLGLHSRREIS